MTAWMRSIEQDWFIPDRSSVGNPQRIHNTTTDHQHLLINGASDKDPIALECVRHRLSVLLTAHDVRRGAKLGTLPELSAGALGLQSIVLSPVRKCVLLGWKNGPLQKLLYWDVERDRVVRYETLRRSNAEWFGFRPDGTPLVAGHFPGAALVPDVAAPLVDALVPRHNVDLQIRDVLTDAVVLRVRGSAKLECLGVRPQKDRTFVALAASGDGDPEVKIEMFAVGDGGGIGEFSLSTQFNRTAKSERPRGWFSTDGRYFALTPSEFTEFTTAGVWELQSSGAARSLAPDIGHTGSVDSISFSADGKRLATTGADKRIEFWATNDGKPVTRLECNAANGRAVCFSPKGHFFAVTCGEELEDSHLLVVDAGTLRPISRLPTAEGAVASSIAFSANEELIAIGSRHPNGVFNLGSDGREHAPG